MIISIFCDAAFAGNLVTRRLQTSILLLINNAPMLWCSKRQNTVEASTFCSEFITLRVGCEMNDGLRFKFCMMGIPIQGPTNTYCDNEVVVSNSSLVESILKKKQLSVCYHKVHKCYAKDAVYITYEPIATNLAGIYTVILSVEEKQKNLQHVREVNIIPHSI